MKLVYIRGFGSRILRLLMGMEVVTHEPSPCTCAAFGLVLRGNSIYPGMNIFKKYGS